MPAMTEMEQRLASPQAESERQHLLERLAGLEQHLRQQAAHHLPREEYLRVAALAEAAQAAQQVIHQWPKPGSGPASRLSHQP